MTNKAFAGILANMGQIICNNFGEPVTYCRKAGPIYQITAVFDVVYSQSDAGGGVPATIASKELDIKIQDIDGSPKQDDWVIISDTTYLVKDVKTSTSGMMKAILREKR